jgi:preprotein translocase subunit SecY
VGGTIFLMWLGEQITARGVGNGISLIIFSGIVAELPSAIAGTLELGRTGALSALVIIGIIVMVVVVITFIVFVERAQRRIIVQYPKRQVGNQMYGGESSHLPLKINTPGVIPMIFASALLLMPADTADNLKKYGGFIPGIRPGKNTADYLDYVLTRLTAVGATYLVVLSLLPEFLISKMAVPFYFGGTSLLIVVTVTMDTVSQVQSHLIAHQYEGLIKRSRLRGRRR